MGQGQHTRCAHVAAKNLKCHLNTVRVKPTSSEISPNSSPTGGTITTHGQMLLVNKATINLRKRLVESCGDPKADEWEWSKIVSEATKKGADLQERAAGQFSGPG